MTEISGRTALVTGGGSGIGRALCTALAAAGARVVVADLLMETAQRTAGLISASGGEAIAVQVDVSERDGVAAMKAAANRSFGMVDLLFANAGATNFERLTDMRDDDIDWIFEVNLKGVINCLRSFLPDMIEARGGHVVATASMAGLLPGWIPIHSCYTASKSAVIGLMLNLRYELEQQGVGASVLCPGPTSTGMKDNNGRYRPARFGGPLEGPVELPPGFMADPNMNIDFREPEDVARLTLNAVRQNHPLIVVDAADRHHFHRTYLDMVEAAFDRAEAFART